MLWQTLKYHFLQAQHPPQAGIQPRAERRSEVRDLPQGPRGVNSNIYDKTSLIRRLNVKFK